MSSTTCSSAARTRIPLRPIADGEAPPVDHADHARTQVAVHGAGLTFGALAIGDLFYWPPPIPRGPEPMVKSADDRYQWSKGYGTAEVFYRVERWKEPTP